MNRRLSKTIPFPLLAFACVLLLGCVEDHLRTPAASSPTTRISDAASHDAFPLPLSTDSNVSPHDPTDAAALRYAYELWLTRVTPYRDSFVSKSLPASDAPATTAPSTSYAQLRKVTLTAYHSGPTYAERLSGIDWRGAFFFRADTVRLTNANGRWSLWRNLRAFEADQSAFAGVVIYVSRVKGRWEADAVMGPLEPHDTQRVWVAEKIDALPQPLRQSIDANSTE